MSELNGKVPLLGQDKTKIRATASALVSLVRSMDENGTFEPESAALVNGQVQATAGRANLCSAEDLVDMVVDALVPQFTNIVRDVIKQELAALKPS